MIPVSLGDIFNIYICLWLIVLAIMWIREELRVWRSEWSVVKERLYICNKCRYTFLAKDDREHITRCPSCNAICFIRKKKRF